MADVQLFLSTVTDEFRSYRDTLRGMLKRPNVDIHVQEDFIPTGTETLDKLDSYIANCDAVVHLAGDMTGAWANPATLQALRTRYPDLADRLPPLKSSLDTGDPPLSYTQWEAYLAVYHRKPLVIALPEPGAPRDAKHRLEPDRQASQRAHLDRLRVLGRHAEFTFGTPDQLAAKVLRSSILDLLVKAGIVTQGKPIALPYPSLGTLFKGRDQFMADLRASLSRAGTGAAASVVSNAVYGLGGIGKTRLAVEYAWQHEDDYNALLFVVANTPEDLRRNLAGLAGPLVLNLPEKDVKEEEAQVAAVLRWLQENPGWFLIIDNVDTEKAAAEVEGMLARLHGGQVLITSRLSRWSGLVERLDLGVLSEDAAQAFLLDRTAKDRRKAEDDPAQAAVVAREVGQLALMLEQAAAYINENRLTFAKYLDEWNANREKVTRWFDPRVMTYPMSVAVTWQTSVDQLGAAARSLLQRLAWLAPEPIPESLVDVAAVGEVGARTDQSRVLAELESYSLVTRARDAPTFMVHRLVQDVTRRSLTGQARPASLAAALIWIDEAFSGDPDDMRVRPMLDLLAPHVRAATDQAEAAGIPIPTARFLLRLGQLLQGRVPLAEVEPFYRRALAIVEPMAKAEPNNALWEHYLSVSYNNVGTILVAQGNLPEALKSFRDSLAIAELLAKANPTNADVQRNVLVAYQHVGDVLKAQGNLPGALKFFRDGLATAEPLAKADPTDGRLQRDLSVFHNKVGDVLAAQGNLPGALESFRDGLAIAELLAKADSNDPGSLRDLSVCYQRIGNILSGQGNLAAALKSFRDSLAIAEQLAKADPNDVGWQRDLSVAYSKVGGVLAAQGNLPEALKSLRQDLAIAERLAKVDPNNTVWQRDLSVSHTKVAGVLMFLGELEEALANYRADLTIADRLATADSTNADWQRDLQISYRQIATVLRKIQSVRALTAEQAQWLSEADAQLAKLAK